MKKEIRLIRICEILNQPTEYDKRIVDLVVEGINKHGLVHPIIVSCEEDGFRLLVGQNRLMAYTLLERTKIPAYIEETS